MKCFKINNRIVIVIEGDITRVSVDAIVNPANSLMFMGGGVAGAIKEVGGKEIENEARKQAPVPIGKAIATGAGRLNARYVIHAPTMEMPAMNIPLENAIKATRAALRIAKKLGIESIAFPAMGTGVGGLRVDEVSRAMAEEFRRFEEEYPRTIVMVAYGSRAYKEMINGVKNSLGEAKECPADLKVFR